MLEGKKIVVTGAAGGLGRVVCNSVQELGATVVGFDLQAPEFLDQGWSVDLTNPEQTQAAFATVKDFDAVLNLAGGFTMGDPTWASEQQWETMFKLNVDTLRNSLAASVPRLLERGTGKIVNVGAYGAQQGQSQMSAYIASKSAVMRITESLAEEVKHKGLNVNAVLPTVIDTPANRQAMPDADPGMWVSPQQLANVICFLASDLASALHGSLVPVRGLS